MQRIQRIELEGVRPNWLTAGALRLGLLSLFIVLTAMVRPRLTHWSAGWLVLGAAVAVVAAAAVFLGATRRIESRLPFLERGARLTDAVFLLLRRIGLPLLGLVFFLVWTFVYIGIWWVHPHDAFRGLEPNPRFADFFYTAVLTAFISPPGDILAHSRGARAATMIEMLTAFALVTAYASSFLDLRSGMARTAGPTESPPGGAASGAATSPDAPDHTPRGGQKGPLMER
ncbi:MAG: hypothetical protein QOE36_1562 [Gaiellaceae bacterium]|nr:hypothetical protein [Gaiellaceae bacterium]